MKTPNGKTVKLVSGTLATAVLANSCNLSNYNIEGNLYEMVPNPPVAFQLYSLETSNLSDEVLEKVEAIRLLLSEVLSDKMKTKEFVENPIFYLQQKQLDLNVKLSDNEINTIKAFSDPEIIAAVNKNDLQAFLKIAKDKKYIIGNSGDKTENLRKAFRTEKDYDEFVAMIDDLDLTASDDVLAPVFVAAVLVLVFGLVATVSAVEIVMGVQIGYAIHVAALYNTTTHSQTTTTTSGVIRPIESQVLSSVSTSGEIKPIESSAAGIVIPTGITLEEKEDGLTFQNNQKNKIDSVYEVQLINNQLDVIKIWTDNDKVVREDVFYKEIIEEQVENLSLLIIKQFPNLEPKKSLINKLLRVNLEGYYGIRR